MRSLMLSAGEVLCVCVNSKAAKSEMEELPLLIGLTTWQNVYLG